MASLDVVPSGLSAPEVDQGSPAPEGRISSLVNTFTSYCTRIIADQNRSRTDEQEDSVGEDKAARQGAQSPVELPRLPFGVNDLPGSSNTRKIDSMGENKGSRVDSLEGFDKLLHLVLRPLNQRSILRTSLFIGSWLVVEAGWYMKYKQHTSAWNA